MSAYEKINDRFHREAVSNEPIDKNYYTAKIRTLERMGKKLERQYGISEKQLEVKLLQTKCKMLLTEANGGEPLEHADELFETIGELQKLAPHKYY